MRDLILDLRYKICAIRNFERQSERREDVIEIYEREIDSILNDIDLIFLTLQKKDKKCEVFCEIFGYTREEHTSRYFENYAHAYNYFEEKKESCGAFSIIKKAKLLFIEDNKIIKSFYIDRS